VPGTREWWATVWPRSSCPIRRGPDSESDIAKELFVSFNTVHTHVRSIYWKLGVSCRADAIERARSLSIPVLDLT
jgi:hypothetical protein